jgi:hypothetical protein
MKDIAHEITNVYITADGRKFLSLEKARKHQRILKKKLSKLHVQ